MRNRKLISDARMELYRKKNAQLKTKIMNIRSELERWERCGDPVEHARAEALGKRTRALLQELQIRRESMRAKYGS